MNNKLFQAEQTIQKQSQHTDTHTRSHQDTGPSVCRGNLAFLQQYLKRVCGGGNASHTLTHWWVCRHDIIFFCAESLQRAWAGGSCVWAWLPHCRSQHKLRRTGKADCACVCVFVPLCPCLSRRNSANLKASFPDPRVHLLTSFLFLPFNCYSCFFFSFSLRLLWDCHALWALFNSTLHSLRRNKGEAEGGTGGGGTGAEGRGTSLINQPALKTYLISS